MSSITGLSSADSVSYATQLAQTSTLKRSLNSIGTAIENGDLTSAGSALTALVKNNPQYAATSSDGSPSQDPINQDFQTLADAISNNQSDSAQSAWAQVKSDLSSAGVTDLSDGTAATAQLLADTKASISQQILSNAFGTSAGSNLSVSSLIGGGSDSSSAAGLSSSLISNWLTYKAGGATSTSTTADTTGNTLNTAA
jgi:hypothetical protein